MKTTTNLKVTDLILLEQLIRDELARSGTMAPGTASLIGVAIVLLALAITVMDQLKSKERQKRNQANRKNGHNHKRGHGHN